jgi:hypothetical protein
MPTGTFRGVRALRDDDVLATPGSPRERGRNAIDQMRTHLDDVEEKRQRIDERDLSPDDVREFRVRRQGA